MEQFVEIWQQANIDDSRMDRVYQTEELVPMIIDLEKKQQKLLRFKTLGSIIMLLALALLCERYPMEVVTNNFVCRLSL